MNETTPKPKIRWRPVYIIVSLSALVAILLWTAFDFSQSVRIVGSFNLAGLCLGLLLLWFLFFSRLSLKIKLIGLACCAALGLFVYETVEIREVSGDVMPILAWSWTPKPDETLANTAISAGGQVVDTAATDHDFPRFMGENSTDVIADTQLARDWAAHPPQEKWRIPIGAAYSAFAVKGNLAVTQEQRGESEMVTCYDLHTGKLIWSHGDAQRFETTVGGIGPRATPTLVGERVYSLGALGLLNCLDLATGTLIWQKNVAEDHHAEKPAWGYSCSPLIYTLATNESKDPAKETRDEALVVVSPGGDEGHSLAAYHAADGAPAWSGGSATPGYSSPELADLAGKQMILIFNKSSVAGHDPSNGNVLWEVPWPDGKPSVANPRSLPGDRVLVSAGYGLGAKMYHITRQGDAFAAELVYESPRLKAKFANFVIRDDYAYGLDDGVLACMKLSNGERAWKEGRYGHGQLMRVGDLLLVQAESGELNLLEANPDRHQNLGAFPVLSGKSWNTFALAGNLLLMRNHLEAVCLELPLAKD